MNQVAKHTIVGRGWSFPLGIDSRGGLTLNSEQNEIDQAIAIILSTAIGTRVMRPTFGCRLHELIFAPNNNETMAEARRYVEEALVMWEPRIQVKGVDVRADPTDESRARLLIEIRYEIKSTHDPRSLVHPFYLIPEE
jgi:phage baseplate assembly protein W